MKPKAKSFREVVDAACAQAVDYKRALDRVIAHPDGAVSRHMCKRHYSLIRVVMWCERRHPQD
jgi:hypothetical protein